MAILFHGTSIQNAIKITKEGFKIKSKNWTSSEPTVYFYRYPDHFKSIQKALWQAGNPAFKEAKICKRAVLAVEIDEKELIVDRDSMSVGHYQLINYKSINNCKILGFWHDRYNLLPFRWFYIFKFSDYEDIVNIKINKDILPLKMFFDLFPKQPISVPIEEKFNNTGICFTSREYEI